MEVGFPQFAAGFPARNRADPLVPIREDQEQNTQIIGCAQRIPTFLSTVVVEVDQDRIIGHRLLELLAGNSVLPKVTKVRGIPVKF